MHSLTFLKNQFPHIQFITDEFDLARYSKDETENLQFPVEIVALPKDTIEVSQLVRYCNENKIAIFPRGAGTGLVGGSLAISKGLMISLEKLNTILEIDVKNFTATVEAGVINYTLQEALKKHQLLFPPDPSSWHSSFIGGNIATNAGGPRAVKYGVTSNWVLNLEVVLPSGDIIWTGANTLKNVTGYNLTQLFIGSEGTLGIITKAVIKIAYKPKFENTMLIPFHKLEESTEAVSYLFETGLSPSSAEFLDKNTLVQVEKYTKEKVPAFNPLTQAQLLISFEGESEEDVFIQMEKCHQLVSSFSIGEILIATTEEEISRIWKTRRNIATTLRSAGFTIEEDTVVPRSKLTDLVKFSELLAQKHSVELVCYGHAGDGNLHIRMRHPNYRYSYQNKEVESILIELFSKVKELGGTLSAEHGIGIIQKCYLPLVLEPENIHLQKSIKKLFDPNYIMNPFKIFKEN